MELRACLLARRSEALPKFYDAMLVVRFSFVSGHLPGGAPMAWVGRPAGRLGSGPFRVLTALPFWAGIYLSEHRLHFCVMGSLLKCIVLLGICLT